LIFRNRDQSYASGVFSFRKVYRAAIIGFELLSPS
jgi:hypothetical protein